MKHNITCMIVDDEPMSIGLLEECLTTLYKNIEITGKYTTWTTALPALRAEECDILFLDISMPGKTGIELLSLLPSITAEIIFITAHSEYALNAIKFSPSGYVLKPIDDKELSVAVDKAMERVRHKQLAKSHTAAPLDNKIGIPNNKGIDYLDINDIIYLEAINNCTKVVTNTGTITSSYTLNRFMAILKKHTFYQVHRSYIINLNYIKRYLTNGSIVMNDEVEIPVSKSLREDFLLQFNKVSKNS